MRPVLMGLAVVASLATSLIGANAQSECGAGLFQESCPSPWEERERAEETYAKESESQEGEPRGIAADRANDWASEHLAAERTQATWWRSALVVHGGLDANRTGWLFYIPGDHPNPFYQAVWYPCDFNYGDALSGGCVPDNRDYDCSELRSWGIVNIPVTGDDWMNLDDNFDGMGCEV